MSELLEIRGLSRSFPGVNALDAVDFTLRSGESMRSWARTGWKINPD
jgi:ABC-type sugar transport system ATPase subunit